MPPLDHEVAYANALAVTEQWLATYHLTHDKRHLHTALTCAAIARERYKAVEKDRQERKGRSTRSNFMERYSAVEAVVWGLVPVDSE